MTTKSIDLSQLFGSVVPALAEQKKTLNQADTYNHNHGDNMVEIFEVITQAMKAKSNATPAEQLAYASQLLQAKSQSGSAQLYAQGLKKASGKLEGKTTVTPNSAVTILQALLGTQQKVSPETFQSQVAKTSQSSGSGADLLGSLLGGMSGETQQAPSSAAGGDLLGSLLGGLTGQTQSAPSAGAGDDLLGSLLGGLTGGSTTSSSKPGQIDISKLLKAGMTYMQAKQSGSGDMDAILKAIMSGSRLGTQEYRTQSGTVVANTLLKALSQMAG